MHYSQMTSAERARARAARRIDAGVVGKDGAVSYFHQWNGTTPESTAQMPRGEGLEEQTERIQYEPASSEPNGTDP